MKKSNYLIVWGLLLALTSFNSFGTDINAGYFEEAVACSSAIPISCNSTQWVNASNQNQINKTEYDISGCFTTPSSYNGNDHVYILDVGVVPQDLTIAITNLTEDLDMILFRSCSSIPGDPNFGSCVAFSANGNQAPESLTVLNATGVYYLVVDGREFTDRSGYRLTVNCNGGIVPPPPPPSGGNCTNGTKLSCGQNLYVAYGGNNSFNEDNYNFSGCTHANYSYEGYDHVFHIDAGYASTNLTIKVSGLNADMDMFVFKSCTPGSGYGSANFYNCAGYSDNSGNNDETINIYGATGKYILIVDGFTHGVNSSFTVSLTCNSGSSGSCYGAETLYCGDERWVPAPKYNNLGYSSYDFSGCYGAGYGYEGSDHLYKIDAGSGYNNQLIIKLSGLSADLDLLLFESCGGGYYGGNQLSDCVDFSTRSGTQSEEIIVNNAHGTYYLAVDSDDPWYNSGYEISVKCNTYAPDICSYATPLWCGESTWVNAPTNNYLNSSNYDYSGCSGYGYGYTGKDHLYKIDVGSDYKDLKIRISGYHADLDLLLYRYCQNHYGQTSLTQCVGYSSQGYGYEEISVPDAHGVYYLAVDSDDPWYSSGYEIEVDCIEKQPDLCHYATSLYCGDNRWVNPATYNNHDYRHYDYNGCLSYNYGYSGKDHLYAIHAGNTPVDLTIHISQLSADLDMLLYKYCGSQYGNYGLYDCVGYSIKSGHYSEKITIYDAKGTYYLAVDADDPWDVSGYEISVYCEEQVQFDCQSAVPIDCGESKWSSAPSVNNISSTDYIWSECSGYFDDYEGYDHLYVLDIGYHEQHLKIELSNMTGDLDLLVFKSCSPSYQNARVGACQGFSITSGYASEKVILENASGTYYIVVDSKSAWDLSGYKIKVTCEEYPPVEEDDEPDDHPDDEPDDEPIIHPDVLTCGGVFYGTTVDGESSYDNDDITQCFQTNLVYTGADVLVPFVKTNDSDVIELVMTQDDANLSLFILDSTLNFVEVSCRGLNYSSNKVVENDHIIGEVFTDEGALAAGTYYALIEGYNRTIESDFTLSMTCGVMCDISAELTCESFVVSAMTSDSINSKNIYTSEGGTIYAGYTGGEWIASLSIDSSTEITIDVHNISSDGDLDLFLLDSCNALVVIAASTNSDSLDEQIVVPLDSGEYIIVVDGWHQASGSFDIDISGCADVTTAFGSLAESRNAPGRTFKSKGISVMATPNPFMDKTILNITVDKPIFGSLELFTMDGQRLFSKDIQLWKGENRVEVSTQEFGDMYGLILYRLITDSKSVRGTLIRVR